MAVDPSSNLTFNSNIVSSAKVKRQPSRTAHRNNFEREWEGQFDENRARIKVDNLKDYEEISNTAA